MATTNGKQLTKEERATLTQGLEMLETSHRRAAKAAKAPAVADAISLEAAKVANLKNRITSGELDL